MLTERQQKLLKTIINSYVEEAQPVASGFLVKKINEKVSSATIRNEMVALEKNGYIEQPHTSAGRIPTEKAYRFYVENLIKPKTSCKMEVGDLEDRTSFKDLAKEIAEYTNQTVIVAFNENDIYYTGLSNLFSKVEFEDRAFLINTTKIIDHLEQAIDQVYDDDLEVKVLIGEENPFGNKCSSVICPMTWQDNNSLLVIMGPMRMDYEKILTIVNKIKAKH